MNFFFLFYEFFFDAPKGRKKKQTFFVCSASLVGATAPTADDMKNWGKDATAGLLKDQFIGNAEKTTLEGKIADATNNVAFGQTAEATIGHKITCDQGDAKAEHKEATLAKVTWDKTKAGTSTFKAEWKDSKSCGFFYFVFQLKKNCLLSLSPVFFLFHSGNFLVSSSPIPRFCVFLFQLTVHSRPPFFPVPTMEKHKKKNFFWWEGREREKANAIFFIWY